MKQLMDPKDASLWQQSEFLLDLIKALSFAAIALTVNYYATRYATAFAGPALPDIVFRYIPRMEFMWLDSYGALYLEYAIVAYAFIRTRALVFFLKSMAVLILVRDVFINMTNLGIPAGTVPTTSFFTQGGDLFFSGHTALPLMAALIFWHVPTARYLLIGVSILLGTEVLLGRQHYSIDVFAAPFIVYGVYTICRRIFATDYERSIS
ncbi:MAG: hypothetical protein KBD06_00455 [Candidatus Pacebacteria bacterium]|nr:hypothetical protein [Candidatus Paceibacterota bacterium]